MSGHSKWASIKHKKAIVDQRRGKLFTKIIREITVAARLGGGDPENNPRLRTAMDTAKEANMPLDNVERAIKKGTGDLEGVNYEELFYEGYGPKGVAIYVACLTDNKNRAASEIRSIFSKNNGNLAGSGSVAWLFEKKGLLVLDAGQVKEDQLMDLAINAGAEDLSRQDEKYEILTDPQNFETVKKALLDAHLKPELATLQMIPKNRVAISKEEGKSVVTLIEALEDHDDVQNVYTNCEFPDN
ncbi:MAG: YebC/PmpR family DNA-binding transcriptional regulator [Candidatus Omnitrophica bacterium CG11_big_fil_rev_8_21_14_0_20_45_26]|uniref:Probable transcriptional regulatory protein COV74_10265 n=1 Tax=Candidatus Abzuiibacterium crystallinum TaxID=1974748 RepID=A0A2H0LKV4_9BACT|nr:MAG: YebC/PmpR family DNA-binding transcriptional regulator [Candidatus Omnitrophica bacterium CG11_big_fil_rev_8_21_14_0_20_45_26]PIW63946.1 MAG: YebC/PmpR family DNA-binding transcriptional regulator [Candidatus Omnitrophica bacterium CG12_big_fil_rev_8_21_14_0_65_45_16]